MRANFEELGKQFADDCGKVREECRKLLALEMELYELRRHNRRLFWIAFFLAALAGFSFVKLFL